MLLTIVTVVFNDPDGLGRTLASVQPHLDVVEHWVVDGSTDERVRELLAQEADLRVRHLSESDDGLYDAMNKGLDRASGDYVLFLNAGDALVPTFDPRRFLANARERVVIGFTVECAGPDRYLRPARDRPGDALASPPHPATAIPRRVFLQRRFDTTRAINADGWYTGHSIDLAGGIVVREVVSEFELGGRSSTYGHLSTLRTRLSETTGAKGRLSLLVKTAMWLVLPPRVFYRVLGRRKYERILHIPQMDGRTAVETPLGLLDGGRGRQ